MNYKLIRYEELEDGRILQFPELSQTPDLERVYATRDRLQAASLKKGVSLRQRRYGIWPC